jgi:uncharacterized protein YjbI with pentapeptide repeats
LRVDSKIPLEKYSPTDANLDRAILNGANLYGSHLTDADLNNAFLGDSGPTRTDLTVADLTDAHLTGSHLNHAILSSATLTGADLGYSDLTRADLQLANLNDANLNEANLSGADLRGAKLANASLYEAKLAYTIFEPISMPELRSIAAAANLELLTYQDNPDALFQLRKQFQDGGFRMQERKITYALKRRETERALQACKSRTPEKDKTRALLWSSDSNLANCGALVLNRVFFDWTCQYGMSPGRPLLLGVFLWLLCSVLYFGCIRTRGRSGLFRVASPSLEHEADPSAHKAVHPIVAKPIEHKHGFRLLHILRREWLLFCPAMFFSLMSAFNIGFRDINFGRWLRLLTRKEFDIKAVGWARVVAGWQSLLSVYLLALWVLTEFSRPFG